MEHRPEERQALEEAGQDAIESPELQEPQSVTQGLTLQMRIWRYPAFSRWISWSLFSRAANAERWLVRRVSWDRPHDMARFADPLEGVRRGFNSPPTIQVKDEWLEARAIRTRLERLGRLPKPSKDVASVYLDGERFGICLMREAKTEEEFEWHADSSLARAPYCHEVNQISDYLDSWLG